VSIKHRKNKRRHRRVALQQARAPCCALSRAMMMLSLASTRQRATRSFARALAYRVAIGNQYHGASAKISVSAWQSGAQKALWRGTSKQHQRRHGISSASAA